MTASSARATRARHPKRMSATQRQALERLYERGTMGLSNRNGPAHVAQATADVLVRLGYARRSYSSLSRFTERVTVTEAGRRRVQEWRAVR